MLTWQFNAETPWHFAILGSDSPQSNNKKGNSIYSQLQRPNVIKHAIAVYLRLPRPTPTPALMRVLHWLRF